jgi:hypothetical protein
MQSLRVEIGLPNNELHHGGLVGKRGVQIGDYIRQHTISAQYAEKKRGFNARFNELSRTANASLRRRQNKRRLTNAGRRLNEIRMKIFSLATAAAEQQQTGSAQTRQGEGRRFWRRCDLDIIHKEGSTRGGVIGIVNDTELKITEASAVYGLLGNQRRGF